MKASCMFDYDSVRALTHLSMFKKSNPKKRMIFYTFAYSILLAVILLEIFFLDADTVLFVLLAVMIAFLIWLYFSYFIVPRIQYNALKKMKNTENEYLFCENVLKVISKSEKYNGEAEMEYSIFEKAYETSKYFFLFQTKNRVFVVNKATIEGGTAEMIRAKLYAYIKDKYIVCDY